MNKLIHQKQFELKEQKELSQCTFKPKTNNYNAKNNIIVNNEKGIYDRSLQWKKRKNEKIDKGKSNKIREDEGHSYKPQLNSNISNNQIIFDQRKSLLNDQAARNYMVRLENARNDVLNKKEILEKANFKKNKWSQRSLSVMRSSSQENIYDINSSIINLHNDLHNINLEKEENKENNLNILY